MQNETNVNGQYKDRLFNFIFGREENREWTLSLYNGIDDKDEESILKLSDSDIKPVDGEPDIDVRVRMINVNYGKNRKIMDACKPLSEYSWLIDKIREYQKAGMNIDEAVDDAVKFMPADFLIKPFLIKASVLVSTADVESSNTKILGFFNKALAIHNLCF